MPAAALEDVLDRLLPIVPDGVRERPTGVHNLELRMRGDTVPPLAVLTSALGPLPHEIHEHEVSDDWRERRLAEYSSDVIGGRIVVRPPWAPPPDPGLIDVVLAESSAFGSGMHPTTRACLELLLELEPGGSFADLGCGSGVLAIVAARLGWGPLVAVDVQPLSVQTARENAERNGAADRDRRRRSPAGAGSDCGRIRRQRPGRRPRERRVRMGLGGARRRPDQRLRRGRGGRGDRRLRSGAGCGSAVGWPERAGSWPRCGASDR